MLQYVEHLSDCIEQTDKATLGVGREMLTENSDHHDPDNHQVWQGPCNYGEGDQRIPQNPWNRFHHTGYFTAFKKKIIFDNSFCVLKKRTFLIMIFVLFLQEILDICGVLNVNAHELPVTPTPTQVQW